MRDEAVQTPQRSAMAIGVLATNSWRGLTKAPAVKRASYDQSPGHHPHLYRKNSPN